MLLQKLKFNNNAITQLKRHPLPNMSVSGTILLLFASSSAERQSLAILLLVL